MTNTTTRGWMVRRLSGIALAWACWLVTSVVSAESADAVSPGGSQGEKDATRMDWFALRAGVGAGVGYGLGTRAGGVIELWPLRYVGIGVEAALIDQSNSHWSRGGTDRGARTLAPFLALRVPAPRTGSLVLHLGGGYADAHRTWIPPICYFMLQGDCPDRDPVTVHYPALVASSAIGWVVHHRNTAFEAGVVGRFEVVMDRLGEDSNAYLATLNVEIGFGI